MGEETPKRKMHPASLAALEKTKWEKGQTGNPGGFSKGRRLSSQISDFLSQPENAELIKKVILGAFLGDKELIGTDKNGVQREPNLAWFEGVMNRIEGKVADKNEISFPAHGDSEVDAALQSLAGGSGEAGEESIPGDVGEDRSEQPDTGTGADELPGVRDEG